MKRNKFSLSHYKLGTCDMGQLIPISWYEVLPGDTIQQASSVFLRFAPMVAPIFTPVRVQLWSFYVPFRLLWSKWEQFRTGGVDGLDSSTPPTISGSFPRVSGDLLDFLGVPPDNTNPVSLLPVRAYYRIWYDYFRDQDLDQPNLASAWGLAAYGDGDETNFTSTSKFYAWNAAWEKDYFTTARPWPQKGMDVTVPVNNPPNTTLGIEGNLDLVYPTAFPAYNRAAGLGVYQKTANGKKLEPHAGLNGSWSQVSDDSGFDQTKVSFDLSGLNVKSSSDGSIGNVKLDDLREAFALQRFQEHRAMYGSRYVEYLRFLGVKSSDARLQRPEYLGGIRNTIQFSEVLQTAADGDNPVGTLRGHGVGATKSKRFRRFIEEDGIIMTLMCVRPVALYTQMLHKSWSRTVKEDYWTKELEHIGQQEVAKKEVYSSSTDPDGVFGFQNRYDEYRQIPSSVCGLFRNTLDYWHLGRVFANQPVLNSSFVNCNPSKRIFAEQTQNEIYFMASHSVQARRLMSKTGNPIL